MNMPFQGAKIALLCEGAVLVLLRDDVAGIPFPGFWDLPGGGREGREAPVTCVLRETREELGLALDPGCITWGRSFGQGFERTWFFVGYLPRAAVAQVRLGTEGQAWRAMPVAQFLSHPKAVPHFRDRLRLFLAEQRPT